VALQKKIGRTKVKRCQFGFATHGFGPAFLHIMLRLVKGTAKPNIYCDLPDSLIGPGGLLLVVSHLFAVPLLVLWAGLEKVNNDTWM
jgi:hypothetical protein